MADKYSREEVLTILQIMNYERDEKEAAFFISDESLAKKYLELYEAYEKGDVETDSEEVEAVLAAMYLEFARRTDKKDFDVIYQCSNVNEVYIRNIIEHPEFFEDSLSANDIARLAISSSSVELMKEVLNNTELNLGEENITNLQHTIQTLENGYDSTFDDMDEIEYSYTDSRMFSESVQELEPFEIVSEPDIEPVIEKKAEDFMPEILRVTRAEKNAIKTYESGEYAYQSLANSGGVPYKIMNMTLFPGVDNEVTRIVYEGATYLNGNFMDEPEMLLQLSTNLWSAMYKYGKTMVEPVDVLRVDRVASLHHIEDKKEIVSNFSTTTQKSYATNFSKPHIAIISATVEPGAVCVDFASILKKEYYFSNESELLIAPFTPVELEEVPITEKEKKVIDAEKKIKMRVKAPEKAIPLNDEEKQDREEQCLVMMDQERREKAKKFISRLGEIRIDYGKELSLEQVIQMCNPEEMQAYIEFKAAYQTILRYNTQEIAFEIDRALETDDLYPQYLAKKREELGLHVEASRIAQEPLEKEPQPFVQTSNGVEPQDFVDPLDVLSKEPIPELIELVDINLPKIDDEFPIIEPIEESQLHEVPIEGTIPVETVPITENEKVPIVEIPDIDVEDFQIPEQEFEAMAETRSMHSISSVMTKVKQHVMDVFKNIKKQLKKDKPVQSEERDF